ncbi:MAG: hypothetical protein OXE50_14660 [Chloroflexi bacterium]|nr:hypothetical protein [Chloroflexota bacterium]
MVSIRPQEPALPKAAIEFLGRSYTFVNEEWPHADRDDSLDRGFESKFRESCIVNLHGWEISQAKEMGLGAQLATSSGVSHEIDIVATHTEASAIAELKNRIVPPSKNDAINFYAKLLDYISCNPSLLLKDVCPVFISTFQFEEHGLIACLGLGIHPLCPGLRPIPILVHDAHIIKGELHRGVEVPVGVHEDFAEFCTGLNNICLRLQDTWFSSRFGYVSEDTIVMKASNNYDATTNYHLLRRLNQECSNLISAIKKAKQ